MVSIYPSNVQINGAMFIDPSPFGHLMGKCLPSRDQYLLIHLNNYKGCHSIVLLGPVNSDYEFMFIDVGYQGCISDGGVFRNTEIYNRLVSDELNLPDPMELPESQNPAWNFTGKSSVKWTVLRHILKKSRNANFNTNYFTVFSLKMYNCK